MNRKQGNIYIGTSGWSYAHWKGPFFPSDLPQAKFLDFYLEHFDSVEINNSFYHLPTEKTLTQWRDAARQGFVFAVKASRYITHMKKLKDPEQTVPNFMERIKILGDKLGPILFQLPPRWSFNEERLESFLQALDREHRYTFECRDPSWFNPKTYELLKRYRAAFCIYDLDGRLSPKEITADFIYVRLHGPDGPYRGQYDTQALAGWAGAFSTWSAQGKAIYCYFDNDEAGYAAQDAGRLRSMLQGGKPRFASS